MKFFSILSIAVLVMVSNIFAQSRLDDARDLFVAKQYEAAARVLDLLIKSEDETAMEGALYLYARVYLARKDAANAAKTCENLLKKYPDGVFAQYAHYTRAEAMYLSENFNAVTQELRWVERNGTDSRLIRRAKDVLNSFSDEFADTETPERSESLSTIFPEKYRLREGRIALLMAFPDPEDPAPFSLERGFRYASDYGTAPFGATIVRVNTSFEAARAARDLMEEDSLTVLLYAGDEGSAMAVTLLSKEYDVPVLKLTSNARSFTEFSPSLYEFLPSDQTQARELGDYATSYLDHPYALILAAENEEGNATSRGFADGVTTAGGTVDVLLTYPALASSVRRELADVFSAEPRVARGEAPLRSVLSKKEREELFGDPSAGEVLTEANASVSDSRESFFFSLSAENIDNFSSQLSLIPRGTTLFGNSSWLDTRALSRQLSVTEGMYIVAPLLPEVSDTSSYAIQYEIATGAPPDPWELLGIDAGEFVGQTIAQSNSRGAVKKNLGQVEEFKGLAVTVDFDGGRENRFARILQHRNGELLVAR